MISTVNRPIPKDICYTGAQQLDGDIMTGNNNIIESGRHQACSLIRKCLIMHVCLVLENSPLQSTS